MINPFEVLKKISEARKAIEEVLQLVIKYKWIISFAGFLAGLYSGAYYIINIVPGQAIRQYVAAVNEPNFALALAQFSPTYQKKWVELAGNSDLVAYFGGLYKTTEATNLQSISLAEGDYFLLNFVKDVRTYDVEYESVDVFKKSDIDDPNQENNVLWARLLDAAKVNYIENKKTPGIDDAVRVRRKWKCSIQVKRYQSGWKILSYNAKEISLVY